MIEKELAIQFATKFNNCKNDEELNNKNNIFESIEIPHFFDKYPNINFELLQQELNIFGLKIEQANKINTKRKKTFQNLWNKSQTVIIFDEANENNL